MKNFMLCTIIAFGFCSFNSIKAQDLDGILVLDINVQEVDCNRNLPREVSKKFASVYKENIFVYPSSTMHSLAIDHEIISSNLLEGIDSYHYVKLEVNLTLTNLITNEKEVINLKGEGKSNTECKSVREALKSSITNKKNRALVKEFLKSFHQKSFENNCSSFVQESEQLLVLSKYRAALSILHAAPKQSACNADIDALNAKIISKISAENCEKEIHALSIIVNTNDVRNIRRNVYRLLRIPPDAPCADEVLDLSTKIGEVLKSNNQKLPEDLKTYNIWISNSNSTEWKNKYLRN